MTEDLSPSNFTSIPLPDYEVERLKALRRYNILDTPPEVAFDRITALAARLFDIPIALVSLVDESRGWFKSCYGFDADEVARDITICSLALLSNDVLIIPDTRQDDRLVCNPFVQSEPGLRFYAGAPLITEDGFTLGTLCLLDTKPRDALTLEQTATLTDLAAMVMDELELRLAARTIARIDALLLEVTQGVAATTGEAYFYALVQHLSKVLEVDYAYIGLVADPEAETLNTIAVYAKGKTIDNFAYSLHDTLCYEVLHQKKLCCYPCDVQTIFPHTSLLEPLKVESYIAIPVCDSKGTAIGLLGMMHSKPLENIQIAESLLTIFSLRIATELERQQAERARQQAQVELENLVEQRTIELSKTNKLLRLEVTERQQAKAALETEQELLKALLDHVQAGIVACDVDGILTLFNRSARKFHGLPEQPLPPEQWADYYDLYLPDGKTRMAKENIPLFRALQEQTVDQIEMMIIPKQGTARTLLASGQAIVDTQGNKQGAVVVMHDITERKQAEAELLISDVALQQMPDAILLTDLEGKIQRWLGNAEQIFGYTAAEAIGKPVNFLHAANIQPSMTAEMIQSIENGGAFCGEVPCQRKDGSEVPIETTAKMVHDKDGNPIFLIGINKDITERKQAEAERAQLIREQTARLEAEADQQRSAFLVRVTMVLGSSLNYEQTLASVADLVVPFFADWCAIDLLEDNHKIHRVGMAHRDPEKVKLGWELHQRYPKQINDAEGVSKVLRTGQAEFVAEIPHGAIATVTQDAAHLQILSELGLRSCIISPLIARGQILGAISFVTAESNRYYNRADLLLAERIAYRAAIAIDNARLYQEAQHAQQAAEQSAARLSRLQRVTAALSESLTPGQVADVIVDQGIAALGASFALVALLDETHHELEVVRTFGYELEQLKGWHRFSVSAQVPLAEAVRTGQPVWAASSEVRAVRYPHLSESYKQHSIGSWVSIPLMVEGRAVGGISFGFSELQVLKAEDQTFILSLAQQCAQAIARTHLYEAEQTARSQAEAANRIKDEFLAVLSHELRTPLNPILGWAKLLQKGKLDQSKTAQALATIERNAKLQAELIEDLLDVSRILQGKLSLTASPVDLADTIQAAIETMRLAAEAKMIQIEVILDPDVRLVSGDSNRLQQVIWNLLSNAVKFSPQGEKVLLHLEQLEDQAQITISDTGRGIHPDFLPHVFDYFRQADGATTRKFGGLGLGLAIVRHLVELHGGTVKVESPGEGLGATFRVWLPLMQTQSTNPNHERSLEQSGDLSNISILVVEDETDTRDFVAFLLEQSGAKVTAVASAADALAVIADFKPDLLLSDIGMPDIDGYMLMQQVRQLLPHQGGQVPAIALTAFAGEINHQQALSAGFQKHISKPVEPDLLIQTIATLLAIN
ncbi:PAS domain S-box protein [Nostoc sp. HG1]|nr:PAS domain S-box protein [Nostoc sp. HG1]